MEPGPVQAKEQERVWKSSFKKAAGNGWFTTPAADLRVMNHGLQVMDDAVGIEDYTAMQYIGDAINVLANGGCDTTKPMDKAHEFINSAYVRIGKSLKILRSIG